ncbi:hypothetical protein [Caballeronia sp. LjRoot31]|uniref:hypothetical protein n=1 Tax=Caballeronia sp. LjRoot31 TaxID=3342324 RepID=UPI003ECFA51A
MIELSAPYHPYAQIDDTRTLEERRREAVRADAVSAGKLVEIDRDCPVTGRKIREFVGAKSAWMDQFKAPRKLMIRIVKDPKPSPYRMADGGRSK